MPSNYGRSLTLAGGLIAVLLVAGPVGAPASALVEHPSHKVIPCVSSCRVRVSGTDNIWGAKAKRPLGGGQHPLSIAIPPGSTEMTINNARGTVSYDKGNGNEPDGSVLNGNWTIQPVAGQSGLSGISDTDFYFYLVGTFLDHTQPATPPATVDYAGMHADPAFSPSLGQVFFIGDGLTGTKSGATQIFAVPPGATNLYLGFADAVDGNGVPGAYTDNGGAVRGTVEFSS